MWKKTGVQFVLRSLVLAVAAVTGSASGAAQAATMPPAARAGAVARDPQAEDLRLAEGVRRVVSTYVRGMRAASPEKETVAAMAAVVGERCQEAAAEFPVRKHTFITGQRIFSDQVNLLLAGDGRTLDYDALPAGSVFGQIRREVAGTRFSKDRFPPLKGIFQGFASRVGRPEDWGKVPLSLPPEEWPKLLPLRVAFDTRKGIDAVLLPIQEDKERCLRVCTLALTMLLKETSDRWEPAAALALVLETINGAAKTAPMIRSITTPPEIMRQAQHRVTKVGHP